MSNFSSESLDSQGVQAATGGGRKALDAGDYNVVITGSALEPNKAKSGQNLAMIYSVLDGAYQGSELREWLAVQNRSETAQSIALSKLKALYEVSNTQGTPTDLIGKTIRIRVSKESTQYQAKSGQLMLGYNNNVEIYMNVLGENAKGEKVKEFGASPEGTSGQQVLEKKSEPMFDSPPDF